jgi:ribosomal protein S10
MLLFRVILESEDLTLLDTWTSKLVEEAKKLPPKDVAVEGPWPSREKQTHRRLLRLGFDTLGQANRIFAIHLPQGVRFKLKAIG